MKFVDKLETMIEGWLKPAPRLPAAGRKWLGENIWWLVLVGVILSAIAFFMSLAGIFTAMSLIGAVGLYGTYVASAYDGMWFVAAVVSLAFTALSVLVMATAISPLKVKNKKGWSLLFLAWVINAVALVVNIILSFSPVTLIAGVIVGGIVLAVSAYLLFEIKSEFARVTKTSKASTEA